MRRLMGVLKADFKEPYRVLIGRFYRKRRLNAAKNQVKRMQLHVDA